MSEQRPINPLDQLASQTIDTLVTYQGIYITGAVEAYQMNNNSGVAGFVQILQRQRDDSVAVKVIRIKVSEEDFPQIDILNKTSAFKFVSLPCIVREGMGGKMKIILNSKPTLKT
jgi:hypothetical protein